jgi:hypothetical protein
MTPTANIPAALAAYDSLVNGFSPQDMARLNSMVESAGYWTGVTGFMPALGTVPGPGMPSTTEQGITGWYIDPTTGQMRPTLAAEQSLGDINGQRTLAATEAFGTNGQPGGETLAANEAAGQNINGGPNLAAQEAQGFVFGLPTIQEQQQGLNTLQLLANENGPSNAFNQQAVLHGLDGMGLSKAVDAIAGRLKLPTVQAPQAEPTAASLSSLYQAVQNAGAGQSGGSVSGGSTTMPSSSGGFSAADGSNPFATPDITQRYIDALPDPNKIVPSEWLKMDQDTRDFLTAGYAKKGYSQSDLNSAIHGNMPGFRAPTASGNSAFGGGFVSP